MVRSVVELTQALVRIPSVNPDGEPGTTQVGEQKCAEYVAEFLQHCGAQAELEEILPGRPNVIGRFPSRGGKKPRILFAPHTDTVGVSGMIIDPFSGDLRDGCIWGRGSSDTKGPMAAMLWALHEMGDAIADLPVEVHFAGFMSEESSQHGSRHFAQHHPDYAFALIGEPTSLQTVHKHKGCVWADVITHGHAVHASMPERGVNAITQMARIALALDEGLRAQLIERGGTDPLLGTSTLNIALIQGGTRSNIVPDHCTLRIDMRVTPQLATTGGAYALLQEWVHRVEPTATLQLAADAPPLDTPAEHPFVQSLVTAGAPLTGAPWFCDAAYLAQGGIPSIAIGPGSIAQAHTKDEYISTADLQAGAAFFHRWLSTLIPLLALLLLSSCKAQPPQPGDGCVWRISDTDSSLYIAGTIHLLRKADHPLPTAYEQAYADSQQLIFELPPEEGRDAKLARLMTEKGTLPPGELLTTDLDTQTQSTLTQWCAKHSVATATFATLRPWYGSLIITTTEFQTLGADQAHGVEPYFEAKAKKDSKATSGLETLDYQISLFTQLTPTQQRELLQQTLLEAEQVSKEFNHMIQAWRSGDTEALYQLLTTEAAQYPELIELFLHQRNTTWTQQLRTRLTQPGNTLVLVGAGHLGGEKGLLNQLKKAGYKVERILNTPVK
jgi:acetylornithine deacetylase/succinyl-diaminopimelate desuccinylase-like protein/uncharacterized protein YbaP (TraB family)